MIRVLMLLRASANDAAFVAGLLMVSWGVAQWSPAAAWVVAGTVLMTIAVWPIVMSTSTRRED